MQIEPMLRWIRVTLLLSVPLASLTAADWPQWRGPEGTGVSQEKGLPIIWHESRSVLWKCSLPEWGASTPIIWEDAVFVTTHTTDDKLVLLRIGKADGKIVWSREVGSGTRDRGPPQRQPQKSHKFYTPAGPSPVTNGRVVVAHFGNGDLTAYDFFGERIWKRNLQDDYGNYTSWYGHANSPVIAGDVVISVCLRDSLADLRDKPIESYLVAHDLATGEVRWKTSRMTTAVAEQCDAYTTPLLARLHGAEQLLVMGANQLDSYDPATGRQRWFLPGLVGGRTVTSPTIWGGMILATRGLRGPLVAVKPKPSGELSHREIAWSYSEGSPDSASPVVWGELLFTVTDDGIARCFDAATGNLKWKERLKGQYKASPIAVEGRVFFLNIDGLCTVVSAAPRFDKLVENQLDDQTLASPAVSGGKVFIRGKKFLYCIGR